MKNTSIWMASLISWLLIIELCTGCQRQVTSSGSFTLAKDSCFKNTLAVNSNIKVSVMMSKTNAQQYPFIPNSLEDMDKGLPITDSVAYLSPNKELRITGWPSLGHPSLKEKFQKELYTYQDLVKVNAYAVTQRMFLRDSTLKIVKNVMYKNCQYPHFIMQGENAEYIYLLKTELSRLSLIKDRIFKNCLVRFPKHLKSKYWGTVHQMMEDAGYYQADTVALHKEVDKFIETHGDTLRKLVKERKEKARKKK